MYQLEQTCQDLCSVNQERGQSEDVIKVGPWQDLGQQEPRQKATLP